MFFFDDTVVNLIFQYELHDAWFRPIVSIRILNDMKNTVILWKDPFDFFEHYSASFDEPVTVSISDEALANLKNVISDDELYDYDNDYLPSPNNIMDGYRQEFYFSDGSRAAEYHGSNIGYCLSSPKRYPFTIKILDAFRKIGEILIAEGINRDYLILDLDE